MQSFVTIGMSHRVIWWRLLFNRAALRDIESMATEQQRNQPMLMPVKASTRDNVGYFGTGHFSSSTPPGVRVPALGSSNEIAPAQAAWTTGVMSRPGYRMAR